MNYLLDTHTWIWWNTAPEKLSRGVRTAIEHPKKNDVLLLSAISIWEVAKLIEKRRFRINIDTRLWVEQALDIPRLRIAELTPEIAVHSTELPRPIHDDPADQIILATARIENAVVLSKDRLILDYPNVKAEW
ncbi:MAG: type II toxin-antitoxin system VapC family toxin [Deltaproteobacteria bacterium]|nr:type II toxin-antitoxin system VapC family toxin [Deltaproteobacteria bacterium]